MCHPATLIYVDEFEGYLDRYQPNLKVGDIYPLEGVPIVKLEHICSALTIAECKLKNAACPF